MARAPSLEASLARLARLRAEAPSAERLAELEGFIDSKHSHAVAVAAGIAGDEGLTELQPGMVRAFDRMMAHPIKRDPGCHGKAAIAEALHALDAYEESLYLTGIRHRQLEPVWGGREDTALKLRTACGRGLVRMRHHEVMLHLADLLADPAADVRVGAAQSLAYHGTEQGLPLLRLKVLCGDEEVEVLAECLLAMMRIAPERSVHFVAARLADADASMAEAAALALGESRAECALPPLEAWRLEAADRGLIDVALTAIAMLRIEPAIALLLRWIREEPGNVAREVLEALRAHRHDEQLTERARRAARRTDVDLAEAFESAFEVPLH